MDASKAAANDDGGTIEARLECSVFTCTSFAIVVVNYQRPRLIASFKLLCNQRDRVLRLLAFDMVVIKGNVHITTLVVDSLRISLAGILRPH